MKERGESPSGRGEVGGVIFFHYALLFFAVIMCSSAGAVFAKMPDVPPFLKASWRLWCQELFQVVPFAFQVRRMLVLGDHSGIATGVGGEERSFGVDDYRRSFSTLALSGTALGFHFGCWVWSISHTSLAHSLLFVSMSPIILNFYGWYKHCLRNSRRPTALMSAGTFLGLVGGALMLLDVAGKDEGDDNSDNNSGKVEPSFAGDFVAFLGAIAMAVYLVCGQSLRSAGGDNVAKIPIFLYAFPVTLFAAFTCVASSVIFDTNVAFVGLQSNSLFGFFAGDYLLMCLYLGGEFAAAASGTHAQGRNREVIYIYIYIYICMYYVSFPPFFFFFLFSFFCCCCCCCCCLLGAFSLTDLAIHRSLSAIQAGQGLEATPCLTCC